MNEYMIELLCFLNNFIEPLLSFELTYFRNSFSYKMKDSSSFKYIILGKTSFLVTLGISGLLGLFQTCKGPYTTVIQRDILPKL